jgi:predicted nucleic acid-binding protein
VTLAWFLIEDRNEQAELAAREKLTTYDAAYLELALRCGLQLATLDADLAAAAERHGVRFTSAG